MRNDNDDAVTGMVLAAQKAGAPPDQIVNFAKAGYIPQPQQWKFHAAARSADRPTGPIHIAMGGDRGGAKSHAVMCQVALDDCQRYAGLDILYLRLVQKAGRKALDQLRSKTIMNIKHRYNRNEGLISFANGSSIVVGHFKNEGDIDKFIGIEFDAMVVEERTQLSRQKLDQLFGSLRTGKPGWRPRSYSNANPGGLGHVEFRNDFVLPYREKVETTTKFIPMSWRHNKFINPEYRIYLMGLQGTLGRMWRDGDWDVGAGTYFINWDEETHIIKPPKRIPLEWPIWCSIDWGWSHPTVVQWHTLLPTGVVYTIREHVANRLLVKQHADKIKEVCDELDRPLSKIATFVAGHDVFKNTGADRDGMTIAEHFREEGIYLTKANVDRINGAQQMATRLGNVKENLAPSWFVSDRCPILIDTMPRMLSDEKRPEDVLKIDADEFGEGGDDSYDCARYGIMVRPINLFAGGFATKY